MRKNHLLRKRIFSIIMTLIMVVSLIPANVWADEIANDGNVNVQDVSNTDSDPNAVDANSNEHTNHCVCGKNHQDIGDHDREDNTTPFEPWNKTDSLPTSGKYYLTGDVTIDSNVSLTDTLTLCLNGNTVNVGGSATIKVKGGGKLILTDCADQQGTIQGSGQPGIEITGSKGTTSDTSYPASFIMYGGTITGFAVAVKVGDKESEGESKFTMYGGTITKNNTGSAAAVSGIAKSTHVGDSLPSSIITMHGGEISSNTGEAGGGVYIGDNCTFNMEGGKISNNTASGRNVSNPSVAGAIPVRNGGGGVYLDSWGKFYMTSGQIADNKASGVGGGVCVMSYVTSYAVSITGGKITGNESTDNSGGGIYGGPAKLTIRNTEISNNKCAGNGGGIYTNKPLTLEDVQITGNTASTNGGYEGGGVKIGGDRENFEEATALTVSGNTSISGNTPNNYYVNQKYLLPVKVSSNLSDDACIGICLNKDTATEDFNSEFRPTTTSDSVVATAAEGVTLSTNNFFADSYNSDYVVRTDVSGGVKFGLCDHNVPEGSDTCSKCNTKFVAVLEPKDEGVNKEYFRDLNGVTVYNKTGTLKLFQDAELTTAGITINGGDLTLDLNGHTVMGGRDFSLYNNAALSVIDNSGTDTKNRMLNVNFDVTAGSALNLYDGVNEQGFKGTVKWIRLTRTGKLVSCGGCIKELWLYRGDTESYAGWKGLKLWQDNDHYCTIGAIKNSETADGKAVIYVKDLLEKIHPGCTLYGTKDGETNAVTGDYVKITSEGVDDGYTDLYLQAHEHKPDSSMKCETCGKALVVEITAMKDGTTKTAYFTKDSNDTTRWNNGQDEAAAQLADWVNQDDYTDAKLIPLTKLQGTMSLTCNMTLVGSEYDIGGVNVKESAEVTFAGGTYKDSISVRGSAIFENGTYYGKITVGSGGAVFKSGTFNSVTVNGGTATVKKDATFAATNDFARDAKNTIEVTGGTLNVVGGTFNSEVTVNKNGSLTISDGKFTNTVMIESTEGACAISGGTFAELKSYGGNLSNLLADGYNFCDNDGKIVNGEKKELTNITVESGHTHRFDADTGACSECGKQMAVSVTVDENDTTYYATREAAVEALNAKDGVKTLRLFQDRPYKGVTLPMETYMLTNGPVTLDLNGKALSSVTFIAKEGVELTLKNETEGGSVTAVQAIGKGSKIIATKDTISDNNSVKVFSINAQQGGRLELSAGTFGALYVVNDGSSASLSGGTYQPSGYNYGSGPKDLVDKGVKFVSAFDLLSKGYRYKEYDSTKNVWKWVTSNSNEIESSHKYTVAYAGVSFNKIYPGNDENYTGDTYLIKLGENATTGSLTLTAVSDPQAQAKYQWEFYNSNKKAWERASWIENTGAGSISGDTDFVTTLTIPDLQVGTYQFRAHYWLKDSDGNDCHSDYSDPLTVVVTRHEHNWAYTAEGATITATCTGADCYLTDKSGGSITIVAPEHKTYGDGNDINATLTEDNWIAEELSDVRNNITYTKDGDSSNKNAPSNAGKYTASITVGAGENAGIAKVEFTINKAPLTVTANDNAITYGDAPANGGVEYSGFVNGEDEKALGGAVDYGYNYVQFGDVGTYAIKPEGLTSDNYEIKFVPGNLTVNPREVTLDWNNTSRTYGDGNSLTVEAGNLVNSDEITVLIKDADKADVGSYTATATGLVGEKAGSYKLPQNATQGYTIAAKDVSKTGDTVEQAVTINDGAFAEPEFKDGDEAITGTLAYSYDGATTYDAVKAKLAALEKDATGDIEYTFTASGNYTGTITGKIHFTIVKLPAPEITTSPAAKTDLVYNGQKQYLITAGTCGEGGTIKYSLDGENYSASVPTGEAAGNYTVYYKVFGNASHDDSAEQRIAVNIAQYDISDKSVKVAFEEELTYNSSEQTPQIKSITAGGLEMTADDYDVTGNKATEAGTHKMTITGKGNFKGKKTDVEFIINKANQNALEITTKDTTYGTDLPLAVSGGSTNGAVTYEIIDGGIGEATIKNGTLHPIKAGIVKVKATRAGGKNYNDVVSDITEIKISKATINLSSAKWPETKEFAYDGNIHRVELTGVPKGITVTYNNNEKTYVGTYKAIANLSYDTDNYALNGNIPECQWSIKAVADPAAIIDNATVTKGGNKVDLSKNVTGAKGNITYTITGALEGCSIDENGVFTSGNATGSCTVTVTVAGTDEDNDETLEYNGKTGTITVTVKETPSGGGGGAVIPTTEVVTKDKTTTSPGDVKTETKIGTDGNKETISKVTVSDANQKEIIKQVKDNKSEEIVINVSEKDIADDASLEINIDKEFIDSIVNDTDAKLTIKTPAGDMTFTKEELKELSEASTGDTITIDPTDDDSDRAEKIEKAKELTAGLGLTARSGKTAKGNVNVVLKNSTMTKDSIKELKELGFTVKYRFYRSTKKSSGYKSMVTKDTASYTNTTGKKGTKYYYKVRVMVYDADGNLVAKSDLKQCSYAARTWSK